MKVPLESLLGGQRNEVVEGIGWDDYLQSPGLNPSTIVRAIRGRHEDGELVLSMRNLKWCWDHEQEDTDDLLLGRAIHCMLFEPGDFERRYVAWEEGRARRGKDYEAFRRDNWGKEVLSHSQLETAEAAALEFVADPIVKDLISSGRSEVTAFKVVSGIQCRGRLDWIATGRCIVDLKTSKDISPRAFGYDFYKYHYDIKLGLYRRWLSQLTGRSWPVMLIALEKKPPYEIAVIPIQDAVLDYGAEKGLKIIKRVRQCIESGSWPGLFGGEEGYLHVPIFEMEDIELVGAEEVAA